MKNVIRRRNRVLLLAGCGVLALGLSGCVVMPEKRLCWNGLYTEEVAKSATSFWAISYTPKPGTPVITIRMPDGRFIPVNELNRNTLAPYFAAGTAFDYDRRLNIAGGEGSILINLRGGGVFVHPDKHGNPKLVVVQSRHPYSPSDVQWKPAISTPDGNTILEFPLQEKELKDLLGKPTKDEIHIVVGPLLA